jgi:hypothetical protein
MINSNDLATIEQIKESIKLKDSDKYNGITKQGMCEIVINQCANNIDSYNKLGYPDEHNIYKNEYELIETLSLYL